MKRLRCAVKEVPADLETPVSAFLKLRPLGAKFLLESVEQGENLGRYSFIGIGAIKTFKVLRNYLMTEEAGKVDIQPVQDRNPLEVLRTLLAEYRLEKPPVPVPNLVGGAVGYVGYDFVRFIEKLPERTPDDLELPICHFFITDTLVVFDHINRKIQIVTLGDPGRIEEILEALEKPVEFKPAVSDRATAWTSNTGEQEFCAAVERAKEYIRAGDIFQVVLSHRMSGEVYVDPFQVYRALRILNPSPYMFFFDFGDYKLVGSSPELHVKLQNGVATCRPIAGTRPRGASPEDDRRLEQELLSDQKERAEHLMLVDLARNDLGRVCAFGTVQVKDFFIIERYSHVMHIVSETRGTLEPGRDQFDLLSLTFPAGTVTGAPKIRAMEIIEELEKSRRGVYAGTTGYFSLTGDTDMCITIRTIVFKGRTACLQAGAGIVYDSDPKAEWQETLNKMRALQAAVELANRGLKL